MRGAMSDQPRGLLDEASVRDALLAGMAHSSEAMVLSDPRLPDHPIIAVNARFEAMTGYPHSAIVGRNCRMLQGPATDRRTARKLGETIASGQGCVEWIVNYRADGSPFWNLLFLSPVHDAEGRLIYFFGNQHDISEGMPTRLKQIDLGRAPGTPEILAGFQDLLGDITAVTRSERTPDATAGALLGMAARLADIGTRLAPGAIQ